MEGRSVTLVVVDSDGAVRGCTAPVAIASPWWQECGPIIGAVPGTTVLRLLDGHPPGRRAAGGTVTYLAHHDPIDDDGDLALQPWTGTLTAQPKRMPWAEPGGPSADLAWVAEQVDVDGAPRQHRTWNLSAVWSIPTSAGTVWLKCVPPFFGHEKVVLGALSDHPVPRLVAADAHRLLLAEMPGEDGHEATAAEQRTMVETLVGIEMATAVDVDRLVADGVPDLRAEPLARELADLVTRLAPSRRPLRRLVDELSDRLALAAQCGVPDTLVHGDPHRGNCRRLADPPIWFDWGDAYVGNPLLDLAGLHRMPPTVVDRWLERWAELVPGSEPRSAWSILEPVAALRQAWVYQRFLDNIEPAEHIYHRHDVLDALDSVEAMVSSGGP